MKKAETIRSRGYSKSSNPDVVIRLQLDDAHKIKDRKKVLQMIRKICRTNWSEGVDYAVTFNVEINPPDP